VYKLHVPRCVQCKATLREGASFCGGCGERQPDPIGTTEAIARYREIFAKFSAESPLDESRHAQLEALRVRLGVSLATHATLCGQLAPSSQPSPSITLAIDIQTLKHLAVGERGLVRWRVANDGVNAFESGSLATALSEMPLAPIEMGMMLPGRMTLLAVAVTPSIAGFHQLTGELRVRELLGEERHYTFDDILVRAAGDGPQLNVIHIDQSSARVVDNSRSTFGTAETAGLVGEGAWQPVPLIEVPMPAARAPAAALSAQRVDFSITTERTTYQLTTTLARGDISTVYGGHARDTQQAIALKLADQSSDNDLLQHETRVLGLLLAEPDQTSIHFVPPRDQFRTGDGRMGTVFDQLDGFDLTQVLERCRRRGQPGLPARHLVWVLRRALAALGWAHKNGILHGNLDPAHILVRPRDHMVWLVDWCWAVVNPARTGQGFKAINEIYSPPEVASRGHPTPASDLYALGKCAIYVVGGDPATKTLPDMDPRLARFLRYLCVESQGGRAQHAWELYQQLERIREQIWGAHEFVPLEL
jgi:hypothetical protein